MQCEPTSTVIPLCAEFSPDSSNELGSHPTRELRLDLDAFAREALEQEAARLAVSVEELARFAILYYLADRDSGRIARQPRLAPPPDQPGQPHPLGKLLDG